MNDLSFLITDIIILLLQLTTITCNGCILFIFFKVKTLRKTNCFRILFFLSSTDFLHAIMTLPYVIYLTANWNPFYIDLDPYYVMILGIPLVAQLKINLTLTIFIAFERSLALFAPVTYRNLSSSTYADVSLFVGCLLAIFDVFLEFTLSPCIKSPNCGAVGCFVSNEFRFYWGTSNMAMGFIVITLTALVIGKLQVLKNQAKTTQVGVNRESFKFKQANRTSVAILLTSLAFVTVPSVGVGFVEMLGYSIFKTVGPFYILGLLCAGACNSIAYVVLNRDMRNLAKRFLLHKDSDSIRTTTTTTIKVSHI